MSLLGVNVDHVATLRQARRTYEPDPVWAAAAAQVGGADLITIHLRQDRRHICDRDLRIMMQTVSAPLNLEMSVEEEIVSIALDAHPAMVTIVPERRQEVTTEGGLQVTAHLKRLREVIGRFKDSGIKTSLFIDPDDSQLDASAEAGADMVELHTGSYAGSTRERQMAELDKLTRAAAHGREQELVVNAGHGLTYSNVSAVVNAIRPHELHIGHSIVARSVFTGITEAVREMKALIHRALLAGA